MKKAQHWKKKKLVENKGWLIFNFGHPSHIFLAIVSFHSWRKAGADMWYNHIVDVAYVSSSLYQLLATT